jgi:glycosyltransferase involved in cell wall biosynthesis
VINDVPLEIALVSTCAVSTPPQKYGGTELVLADLARELVAVGHRPTVFATGDSKSAGARRSLFEAPVWPPDAFAELRHSEYAWEQIAKSSFDVVHVNTPIALPFERFVHVPTVATVHHARLDNVAAHYAAHPNIFYAAISKRQRELSPDVPFRAVIHHGLHPESYAAGAGDGGYCAFLGRFAREKAPHLAIDAARAAGLPLRLAGEPHPSERDYVQAEVVPRLGAGTTCIGEVGHDAKVELLRGARCLLMPIQWEEPFGLVLIEAMLVGTPVIAFDLGSARELVEEGITGFLCNTINEMATRIGQVNAIDRRLCRERARVRWGAARMAREYVDLYHRAIESARGVQAHEVLGGRHVSPQIGRAR